MVSAECAAHCSLYERLGLTEMLVFESGHTSHTNTFHIPTCSAQMLMFDSLFM